MEMSQRTQYIFSRYFVISIVAVFIALSPSNISQVCHYSDVIMSPMASQVTGVSIVYQTVCSGADQRRHQSPSSLAFVRGSHRWPFPAQRAIKCLYLMTSSCYWLPWWCQRPASFGVKCTKSKHMVELLETVEHGIGLFWDFFKHTVKKTAPCIMNISMILY